jgi:hypothetical protein
MVFIWFIFTSHIKFGLQPPNKFNNDYFFIGQYLVFFSPPKKNLLFGILNEGFNKGLDFYQLFAQGRIYGLDSFACFLTLGYLGP